MRFDDQICNFSTSSHCPLFSTVNIRLYALQLYVTCYITGRIAIDNFHGNHRQISRSSSGMQPRQGELEIVTDLSHTAPVDVNIQSSVLPPMALTIVLGPTIAEPTVINSTIFFPTTVVQPRRARLGWTRAGEAMPLKAAGVTPRTAGRATTRTAGGVACRKMEDVNGRTAGTVPTWTARGLTARTAGVVMGPTRKRVRTRRTATMNDLGIPDVVPFLFFFLEKKLIILQSRMKSSGCQLGDAQTLCRIVSLEDARQELEVISNL